jgi:hypothetical protein
MKKPMKFYKTPRSFFKDFSWLFFSSAKKVLNVPILKKLPEEKNGKRKFQSKIFEQILKTFIISH